MALFHSLEFFFFSVYQLIFVYNIIAGESGMSQFVQSFHRTITRIRK